MTFYNFNRPKRKRVSTPTLTRIQRKLVQSRPAIAGIPGVCLLYPTVDLGGYALVSGPPVNDPEGKKILYHAHKFCWERENGPVPSGYRLRNLCGNKNCCNAKHWDLFSYPAPSKETQKSPKPLRRIHFGYLP